MFVLQHMTYNCNHPFSVTFHKRNMPASLQLRDSLPEIYEVLATLSIFFNDLVEAELLTYRTNFTHSQSMWSNITHINVKLYHPICGLYSLMTRLHVPIPDDIHLSMSLHAMAKMSRVTDQFQLDYM